MQPQRLLIQFLPRHDFFHHRLGISDHEKRTMPCRQTADNLRAEYLVGCVPLPELHRPAERRRKIEHFLLTQNLRQIVIKIPGLFRIIQHENIRTSHHLRTSCGHTAEQQRSGRRAQSFRENRPRGTVLQSLCQSLYRLMPCIEGL